MCLGSPAQLFCSLDVLVGILEPNDIMFLIGFLQLPLDKHDVD